MDKKAIDCMVQHIKTFHDQAVDEVVADFGEPCQTCPHVRNCSYDWLSVIEPIHSQSTVKISLLAPAKQNEERITSAEEMRRAMKTAREYRNSFSNDFANVNAGFQ